MRFYLNETARARGVQPPRAPKSGDAGYDIRSCADMIILPGEQALVPTGLHVAIPTGWVGLIKDRSSVAAAGAHTTGGVIDASYRGEIKVIMRNAGQHPFHIHINDRIAQLVIVPCYTSEAESVEQLADLGTTERAQSGFGSTGRG
ncbi:MAG: dUTP diphosphatase [Anaerolineae bacterium]|nr:dUTP diphosphatase [Thermoflexales bacterium]MDW8407135.1 dUTP diphosphatase [Anaerolineae bacterium]